MNTLNNLLQIASSSEYHKLIQIQQKVIKYQPSKEVIQLIPAIQKSMQVASSIPKGIMMFPSSSLMQTMSSKSIQSLISSYENSKLDDYYIDTFASYAALSVGLQDHIKPPKIEPDTEFYNEILEQFTQINSAIPETSSSEFHYNASNKPPFAAIYKDLDFSAKIAIISLLIAILTFIRFEMTNAENTEYQEKMLEIEQQQLEVLTKLNIPMNNLEATIDEFIETLLMDENPESEY